MHPERRHGWTSLAPLLALLLIACGVPKKQLDAQTRKADEAEKARKLAADGVERCQKDRDTDRQELATRRKEATEAGEKATRAEQNLETVKKDFATKLQASQEEVDKLAQARLEAEKQANLLTELTSKFRALIDAKQLSLKLVHGRMVLKLRSSVLFGSASADLSNAGKTALKNVAKALKEIKGNHFQVAGHTDNNPIKSAKFPSNWELSTARSVAVVKFLQEEGVPPENLSAAGFAAGQPVYSNSFKGGRQANRRIEISLLPAITKKILDAPAAPAKGDARPRPRK
jgi:chemotaxis protein MotB